MAPGSRIAPLFATDIYDCFCHVISVFWKSEFRLLRKGGKHGVLDTQCPGHRRLGKNGKRGGGLREAWGNIAGPQDAYRFVAKFDSLADEEKFSLGLMEDKGYWEVMTRFIEVFSLEDDELVRTMD